MRPKSTVREGFVGLFHVNREGILKLRLIQESGVQVRPFSAALRVESLSERRPSYPTGRT